MDKGAEDMLVAESQRGPQSSQEQFSRPETEVTAASNNACKSSQLSQETGRMADCLLDRFALCLLRGSVQLLV